MVFLTLRGTVQGHGGTGAQAHSTVVEHEYVFGARAMGGVVLVLSALTLVLGYLGGFFATRLSPGVEHEGPFAITTGALVALGLVAAGIALAWVEFGKAGAARIGFAERNPAIKDFLANNWYVDRLYNATIVRWTLALSRAAKWNDHTVLDGASDVVADGTVWGGRILSMVQNGYVQAYLAAAISVVAALGIWLTRMGGQP
jgi:NADH:ubiquinone oxidoreductase subunit 5 (subunit L)/multisubunit Na+/H+ antiporter MnhA subunit